MQRDAAAVSIACSRRQVGSFASTLPDGAPLIRNPFYSCASPLGKDDVLALSTGVRQLEIAAMTFLP